MKKSLKFTGYTEIYNTPEAIPPFHIEPDLFPDAHTEAIQMKGRRDPGIGDLRTALPILPQDQ